MANRTANRGHRPAWKPTDEERQRVTELMAIGATEEEVAHWLKKSPMTVRKHLKQEMAFGRIERRAEVVSLLFASARNGNVSAQKKLEEMTAVAGAQAAITAPAPRPAPRLGKKEQRAVEAAQAGVGSEWGDDLGTVTPPISH